MNVPVLCYHSHRIGGSTYATNDHVALESDLHTLDRAGFRVTPLHWIAEWVVGLRDSLPPKPVGLTFDDGVDTDFHDLEHAAFGPQASFLTILRRFREAASSRQPDLEATAFVIASAQARNAIGPEVSDSWWADAERSGLIAIQNHSWDHRHRSLVGFWRSSFRQIRTYAACTQQVAQAGRTIRETAPSDRPSLLAYPYGTSSRYMRRTYLPLYQKEHETIAAFSTAGGYVSRTSNRWNLPRLPSGDRRRGWTTEDQFRRILARATR